MKHYLVKVNCPGHAEITVEAENELEAIEKAENDFVCDQVGGEYESMERLT